MSVLTIDFFLRSDVVQIARELIGTQLFTRMNGVVTSGIICETEAYAGVTDRASHAFGGRRTARTEVMYARGGTAYVYLCYGIHSLFNIVTNAEGIPHAVLIRGIVPVDGKEIMAVRLKKGNIARISGIGPGNVSRILGIHYSHTGLTLANAIGTDDKPAIWLEDSAFQINPGKVFASPRVGVGYAGEDAGLPYRFRGSGIIPVAIPGNCSIEK